MEFGIGERIAGDAVPLQDRQGGLDRVEKGHRAGAACFQIDLLGNLRENDMGRHIFLRDAIAAHGDGIEEDAPCAVCGGAGRKAAVDLLDTVGHALNGFPVGNVLLDDFKAGLFVVNESDLGGFAGAQRHGLLRIAHDVRLWYGFLAHDIDTGRNGRERCGAIRPSRNGGGITSGNGLNGQHRARDRRAGLRIGLDDLHAGQFIVRSGNGILLVPVRGVHIDADRRGVCTVPCWRFGFHEGPQSFGDVLYLDHTAIFGHIAADDLTVTVNIEFCTVQPAGRSGSHLLQGNVRISRGRSRLVTALRRILYHQLTRTIVVEKRLVLAIARKGKHRPFCAVGLYDGCNFALYGIFLDLTLKCRVLLRLLREHPVDEAQIHLVGIGVGIAARVTVSAGFSFIALMVPHIGLDRHKELAYIGCIAVVDVGHEPLDIGKRRGVHLTKAAVGNSSLEHGVGIRIGSRSVGIRIKE